VLGKLIKFWWIINQGYLPLEGMVQTNTLQCISASCERFSMEF